MDGQAGMELDQVVMDGQAVVLDQVIIITLDPGGISGMAIGYLNGTDLVIFHTGMTLTGINWLMNSGPFGMEGLGMVQHQDLEVILGISVGQAGMAVVLASTIGLLIGMILGGIIGLVMAKVLEVICGISVGQAGMAVVLEFIMGHLIGIILGGTIGLVNGGQVGMKGLGMAKVLDQEVICGISVGQAGMAVVLESIMGLPIGMILGGIIGLVNGGQVGMEVLGMAKVLDQEVI